LFSKAIQVWSVMTNCRRASNGVCPPPSVPMHVIGLKIACWNCRNGVLYINSLFGDDGVDVLVLAEHWLWPYELHKLCR
jgi:hypothetical protein